MKTVMITGVGGPSGMGAIQSLKDSEKDYRIIGADMDKYAPGLYQMLSSYVIPGGEEDEFPDRIIEICRQENIDVLFPTVDQELVAVAKIKSKLESIGTEVLIPNEETIWNCRSKWKTYQLAKENGLKVPKSVKATEENAREKIDQFDLPVVVRPFHSRGARGIGYVHSREELPEAIKEAKKIADNFMLQEYIPGQVYTVGVLLDENSEAKASVVLKKLKEEPDTGGVALSGKTIINEKVRELGEKYAKALNWQGLAGPEIKYNSEKDEFKLMEVNPRLFGYNYLAASAGVNLAESYIRLALGEEVKEVEEYKGDLKFVRSWQDKILNEFKQ